MWRFSSLSYDVVITSDNAGVFFSGETSAIVEFRTWTRLLRHCDGDMHYVIEALRSFGGYADRCLDARRSRPRSAASR